MRHAIGWVVLLTLFACGEAGSPNSPKERRNEERPIERELRQLRAPSAPARGPVASIDSEGEPFLEEETAEDVAIADSPRAASMENATVERPRAEPLRDEAARVDPAPIEVVSRETVREAEVVDERVAPQGRHESVAPLAPIALSRVVVASGIEGREPSGTVPFASAPERIYVFIEAENPGPSDRTVQVVFQGPASAGRPVQLAIPVSRRWRTWATTRRVEPGTWTVRVLDEADHEIGRATYEIPSASLAT